jgi:hypothetical protein
MASETYKRLRKLGWSHEEASARAAVIARAEAGPCRCQHVRHLPGDDRCPASPQYAPPPGNEVGSGRNESGFRTDL